MSAEFQATIEKVYGLLWIVPVDRSTNAGQAVYLARKAVLEHLDKEGQKRGIVAARVALGGGLGA